MVQGPCRWRKRLNLSSLVGVAQRLLVLWPALECGQYARCYAIEETYFLSPGSEQMPTDPQVDMQMCTVLSPALPHAEICV